MDSLVSTRAEGVLYARCRRARRRPAPEQQRRIVVVEWRAEPTEAVVLVGRGPVDPALPHGVHTRTGRPTGEGVRARELRQSAEAMRTGGATVLARGDDQGSWEHRNARVNEQ